MALAVQLEYDALPQHYDEMLAGPGAPRAHWLPFVRSVAKLGQEELGRRWEQAQRLIHENGVTYNVYGDPRGMDRPWELDPFPLLISSLEWERLSSALAQRARVLNRLLVDLYGPQRLLREGLIPAELVFAHPGFLRPCHGLQVPEDTWLALYAADLARSADGRWWAIADRTQAPSGAGYALENRIVLSSAFPEAFRDSHVERLAGFFVRLRETLRHLARQGRTENPRIALLTPGPYNETYFEHAYLARYLGFTLVEGADLTVRDRALYLKTLGGLERVDVLLRRVDDGFCDPLSLRSDSSLGVAGLIHAARAGNVVVANALGSGLVESPALLAFLPGLCRTLLGEELQLPSVATWWCGHADALAYVLDHLDGLVLKPTFSGQGMEPVFGARLSAAEREAFLAQLRARPHAFVAQEQVALSTAPVWDGGSTQPRHIVLRTYSVASDGSYEVMPGGLTRAAVSQDSLVVSMQRGGGSKDTWVCTQGAVNPVSLLQPAG
ncbi:MAG TPA: circularly permuted type 2 ATP-grasp protein, partial [Myxococcota bacterium]|nr:circularly permuted type 2 ATP-grasp protein [Myxococcota bacterium]